MVMADLFMMMAQFMKAASNMEQLNAKLLYLLKKMDHIIGAMFLIIKLMGRECLSVTLYAMKAHG